jgi:hypothetical protein
MNRRLLLATLTVAVLGVTAGCLGFGTGDLPEERMNADPPGDGYAWDANATAHIEIQTNAKFTTVYRLNQSEIELYRRDGFGGRNPLSVEAVRYRYPNGTVITGGEMIARGGTVSQNRDVVTVALPSDAPPGGGGQLAFTGSGSPKRFSLPTFVKGSYEVVLPPDRHVEFPLFGTVNPSNYELSSEGDRVNIYWENVTADTVSVQFYLQRDLYVFAGIVALLGVVGLGGLLYYRRQIASLQEEREEMGLDVDVDDDDFGDGPPPGMR